MPTHRAFVVFPCLFLAGALVPWIAPAPLTAAPPDGGPAAPAARQASLAARALEPLPLGSIKPAGWIKAQLRLQADGLGGHLDEFWPDIKDSAWFGGKAEGWERVPYWIDGMVPLAFLLDDDALKAKVRRAVDYILEHQQPDGWLGPIGDSQKHKPYDVWPLFPLFKALTQYQDATGDPRVVSAMLKCCHKIDEVISKEPMYSWAKFRAADLVVSLYWLYDRTGEAWLLGLARKAFDQGHDWRAQYDDFKFTSKTQKHFGLDSHGVNNGMALKYAGLRYRLTRDPLDKGGTFRMLGLLDRHHGQATGIFTCDEHLAGRSPSQGTELCTVVEAMNSLEILNGIFDNPHLAERLEKLAFNALPATFKKDMTAHQYDQQCNQVVCSKSGEHVYVNNGPDANLYGLEPNFGCCTANFHQGWPKFVSHLWMKSADGGLAAVSYAPCVVSTTVQGKPVKLAVETEYPFRDWLKLTVTASEPVSFPIHLRASEGAYRIDAAPGLDLKIETRKDEAGLTHTALLADWKNGQSVTIDVPMPVRIHEGANGAAAIARGPLVFALPIKADWKKVRDHHGPFADWEVYPKSNWNYALQLNREHPERSIVFEERAAVDAPFSGLAAPIVARVKGRRLPDWGLERGASAPPPKGPFPNAGPVEELTLVPYGQTDLRITEFPVAP